MLAVQNDPPNSEATRAIALRYIATDQTSQVGGYVADQTGGWVGWWVDDLKMDGQVTYVGRWR